MSTLPAGTRLLFEGTTPIGRNYRVLANEVHGLLHFERDFDFEPGVWHREGSAIHPADDWAWALGQHIIGGEKLQYVH